MPEVGLAVRPAYALGAESRATGHASRVSATAALPRPAKLPRRRTSGKSCRATVGSPPIPG
jgi:hypothetical protein